MLLIRSLVTIESVGRHLDPHFDIAAPARAVSQRALRCADSIPTGLLNQTTQTVENLQRIGTLLPDLLSQSLDSIKRGELNVRFDLQGFERLVRQLTRASNTLAIGIVIAGLLVASSLALRVGAHVARLLGFRIRHGSQHLARLEHVAKLTEHRIRSLRSWIAASFEERLMAAINGLTARVTVTIQDARVTITEGQLDLDVPRIQVAIPSEDCTELTRRMMPERFAFPAMEFGLGQRITGVVSHLRGVELQYEGSEIHFKSQAKYHLELQQNLPVLGWKKIAAISGKVDVPGLIRFRLDNPGAPLPEVDICYEIVPGVPNVLNIPDWAETRSNPTARPSATRSVSS